MRVDYDEYHRLGRTEQFGDVYERTRVRTVEAVLGRCRFGGDGVLLDVGSGEGRYLNVWRRHFPRARIVALEVSAVASARSADRYQFAEHVVSSAESLPFADESIDAIVSVEVLEHIPSGMAMLCECSRVLKPGGSFLLSTPCGNRGSLEWWRAWATGNIEPGSEHGIRFGRFDDPTHVRRYRSRELVALCESLGFKVDSVRFNGHAFLWLGEVLEVKVKGKVNLGRRSLVLEREFERLCDFLGLLDWRLLRCVPLGSSQIITMHKLAA